MAVQTAATTIRENLGSVTLLIFNFTSVADGDTFASGLGSNIVGFWAGTDGNPVTQASAGNGVTNSSGNFSFFPGENSLGLDLFVLARV